MSFRELIANGAIVGWFHFPAEPLSHTKDMIPRSLCVAVLLGGVAFANLCSSAFYPTNAELRWRYRNLNDNQVYTQTFTQTGSSAVVEQRRYAERIETTQWTCTPQGLRTLPESEIPIPGGSVRLTRLTGVIIPSNETWRVGGRWSYRYELKGRIAVFDLSGFLEVENRIVAKETIAVAAGRFETLRVEASFRGEFGIGFGGRATYWFAEGVGVVKQVSEGGFGGLSSELIEFGRS